MMPLDTRATSTVGETKPQCVTEQMDNILNTGRQQPETNANGSFSPFTIGQRRADGQSHRRYR